MYPNKATGNLTSFFDSGEDEISSQPNRLIWGDNLLVMQALLAQGYEGQIDLIYIDPPFNTGENFNFPNEVKIGGKNYEREMPMNERLAYSDTWERGIDSFLDMLYPRLQLMRRLLSENGSIYVHTGPNISHFVKIIMDEIFGSDNYRNEIIWQRFTFHADANRYGIVHDDILFYSKNKETIWNPPRVPLDDEYIKSHFYKTDEKGRPYRLSDSLAKGDGPPRKFGNKLLYPPKGTHFRWSQEKIDTMMAEGKIVFTKHGRPAVKRYLDEIDGRIVHSIWTDIFPINSQAKERLGYPTQKPESLLERIINASSNESALIADFLSSRTHSAPLG